MLDDPPPLLPARAVTEPRVRKAEVACMLGVSARTVLDMARAGKLPGAARFGSLWTFDPAKVAAYVARQEAAALCPQTSSSVAASGTRVSIRVAENTDAAYERLISRTRKRRS